jgi:hypothetical protein
MEKRKHMTSTTTFVLASDEKAAVTCPSAAA